MKITQPGRVEDSCRSRAARRRPRRRVRSRADVTGWPDPRRRGQPTRAPREVEEQGGEIRVRARQSVHDASTPGARVGGSRRESDEGPRRDIPASGGGPVEWSGGAQGAADRDLVRTPRRVDAGVGRPRRQNPEEATLRVDHGAGRGVPLRRTVVGIRRRSVHVNRRRGRCLATARMIPGSARPRRPDRERATRSGPWRARFGGPPSRVVRGGRECSWPRCDHMGPATPEHSRLLPERAEVAAAIERSSTSCARPPVLDAGRSGVRPRDHPEPHRGARNWFFIPRSGGHGYVHGDPRHQSRSGETGGRARTRTTQRAEISTDVPLLGAVTLREHAGSSKPSMQAWRSTEPALGTCEGARLQVMLPGDGEDDERRVADAIAHSTTSHGRARDRRAAGAS